MGAGDGFFASLGGMLGEALRSIVAGLKWLLGGIGVMASPRSVRHLPHQSRPRPVLAAMSTAAG